MSAVREWAASQDSKLSEVFDWHCSLLNKSRDVIFLKARYWFSQAVAVNNLGKWKTATQMTALTILLAARDSRFGYSLVLVPDLIFFWIDLDS